MKIIWRSFVKSRKEIPKLKEYNTFKDTTKSINKPENILVPTNPYVKSKLNCPIRGQNGSLSRDQVMVDAKLFFK